MGWGREKEGGREGERWKGSISITSRADRSSKVSLGWRARRERGGGLPERKGDSEAALPFSAAESVTKN